MVAGEQGLGCDRGGANAVRVWKVWSPVVFEARGQGAQRLRDQALLATIFHACQIDRQRNVDVIVDLHVKVRMR